MWILMAVEQPAITAVIARLPELKKQLAIFGVIFALALVVESPIIQMLSAGTALGTSRRNYGQLLRFMHILGGGLTILHILLLITPLFDFLIVGVVGMPEEFLPDSRLAFLLMTPWTAAVGYRRLWQGVLIRRKQTAIIPLTMVARLLSSAVVLVLGLFIGFLPGAALGGIALTIGVIAGAAASYIFLRREVPRMPAAEERPVSYGELFQFYYPLALTSFITLSARPILSVGIARAVRPIDSLAAWPVIMGFIFLFNSMALSYQEIVISLHNEPGGRKVLAKVAFRLGLSLFLVFQLVVWTPASRLWFQHISGLEKDLLELLPVGLFFLAFTSPVLTFISYQRGRLINAKRTGIVSRGVLVNLFFMVGSMFAYLLIPDIRGVPLASAAFLTAMLAEGAYLWRSKLPVGSEEVC